MKKSIYTFILSLASGGAAFALSFHSSGKDSIVSSGTYDSLYDDGRANLAVILDEYGMTGGVGEGVVINYTGSDSLSQVNGIRMYKKGASLVEIGDIYADINMNFAATSSSEVSGIFLRAASQAEGKSVFVSKIDVTSSGSSGATSAVNNYDSFIGAIVGLSEAAEMKSVSEGNSSFGIWNQVGGKIGGISNVSISAEGGKSQTYTIRNDWNSSIGDIRNVALRAVGTNATAIYNEDSIGNLSSVRISAEGSNKVYGIDLTYGVLGNVSDSTISVSGGNDTIGIFACYADLGELSNVNISAKGNGYAAGILFLASNAVVTLKNSSFVSASSLSGSAYSIANESGSLTLEGDSTTHTLDGNIYTDGKLVFNGNFKLQNASIEVGEGVSVSGASTLSWYGGLSVSGGDVVLEDGAVLNVYFEEVLSLDEYMVLESDGTIALGEIQLNVYDNSGALLEDWTYELRNGGSGDQIWITSAIPEPSECAALFAVLALGLAACRKFRRKF